MAYKNGTTLIIWAILLVSLAVLALVISLVVRQTQKKESFPVNGKKIVYITDKTPSFPFLTDKDSGTTYITIGKKPVFITLDDAPKVGTTFTIRNAKTTAAVQIHSDVGFRAPFMPAGATTIDSYGPSVDSTITLTSLGGLWDVTDSTGWIEA